MKSFFRLASIAAVTFAFAGCGPDKASNLAPNPVAQWTWSDPERGIWRLDINADGTFQREITDPKKPKPASIHGEWTLLVPHREVSWMERHGLSRKSDTGEDLVRDLGSAPDKDKFQFSAPGMLTFHYTVPEGTRLVPGASWTGESTNPEQQDSKLKPSPEIVIGETRPIRNRIDKATGEVFLDLGDKTFQKAAPGTPPLPSNPVPAETPAPSTPRAATPTPATPIPSTPAPATPIPATPVSSTPAVPSPIPQMPVPALSTPIPLKLRIATPLPTTAAPATPASTPSPPTTPIRVTPIPASRPLPTPAPTTPLPTTPVPTTPFSTGSIPITPIQATRPQGKKTPPPSTPATPAPSN